MHLLTFAASLYKKLAKARPATRDRVKAILTEVLEGGAIPLGIHKDAVGDDAYWWLLHDASRFPTEDAMMDALEARSPRGMKMVVLRL
ncbi:MAG TPA: hypothetical protein VL426_01415 [Candidatus Binatia bacterium]|jgi:hypothetical protein|nr:hypothetical protein [Candidatus Binatia bacterium]